MTTESKIQSRKRSAPFWIVLGAVFVGISAFGLLGRLFDAINRGDEGEVEWRIQILVVGATVGVITIALLAAAVIFLPAIPWRRFSDEIGHRLQGALVIGVHSVVGNGVPEGTNWDDGGKQWGAVSADHVGLQLWRAPRVDEAVARIDWSEIRSIEPSATDNHQAPALVRINFVPPGQGLSFMALPSGSIAFGRMTITDATQIAEALRSKRTN